MKDTTMLISSQTFASGLTVHESGAGDRESRAFHDPRLRSIPSTAIHATANRHTDVNIIMQPE